MAAVRRKGFTETYVLDTQEEMDSSNLKLTRAGCDAVWRTLDTGAGCHPFRWLGERVWAPPSFMQADVPKGYEHWLRIVDDVTAGLSIDVFYPRRPKEGQQITVIVDGADVAWTHGEPGLFYQHVYPLLGAARLPHVRCWGRYTGRVTMMEMAEHFARCLASQGAANEAVRVAGILGSTGKRLREVSRLPIAEVEDAARSTLGLSLRELRTRYSSVFTALYCPGTMADSFYRCDVLRVGYDPVAWSSYLGEYVCRPRDESEAKQIADMGVLPAWSDVNKAADQHDGGPCYAPDLLLQANSKIQGDTVAGRA